MSTRPAPRQSALEFVDGDGTLQVTAEPPTTVTRTSTVPAGGATTTWTGTDGLT